MVPLCDRWTRGWNQTMDATNCSLSNSCFDRSRRLQEAIHLQGARHGDLGINGGSFDASLHLRSHFISDVTKTGTNATNFGRTFQKTGSEVELGKICSHGQATVGKYPKWRPHKDRFSFTLSVVDRNIWALAGSRRLIACKQALDNRNKCGRNEKCFGTWNCLPRGKITIRL